MTDAARELSQALLATELPRRWAHTQGVARQATTLRATLRDDADLVESAAWLHDIGYAAPLVTSGLHPLDGARHLRDSGFGDRALWTLVAQHTGASVEAEQRGLDDVLAAEFPVSDVDPFLLTALTYCDVTTGPDGSPVDVAERLAEILARYPPDHVVHKSISRSAPILRAQAAEISAILETA